MRWQQMLDIIGLKNQIGCVSLSSNLKSITQHLLVDFYANMQYLEKFLSLEETPCSMKFTSGTYMCFEMSGLFGCGMYCFLHSIVCCVCRKTNYVDILNSSSFLSPLSTLWLGYKQNIVQLKRSKIYIRIRHLLWQKGNRFSATYVWHSCAKLLNIFNIE